MAAKSIGTLKAALQLDSRGFALGFDKAKKDAKSGVQSISSVVHGHATSAALSLKGMAVAAVTSVLSVGAAVAKLSESFQSIDRQAKIADRLGASFESVQRLSVAASLSSTDLETLVKAMQHANKEFGSGGKSLDKRFLDLAVGISKIKDPAERARKATEAFGKSGFELLDLINNASRIQEVTRLIDRFGLSLTRADAAKIEQANDAITSLSLVTKGLTNRLAVELAPQVARVANATLDSLEKIGDKLEALEFKWKDVGKAAEASGNIIVNKLKEATAVFGAFLSMMNAFGRIGIGGATGGREKIWDGILKGIGFGGAEGSPAATAAGQGNGPLGAGFGKDEIKMPKALELNTADAVSAIYKANRQSSLNGEGPAGDGIAGVNQKLQKVLAELKGINGNTNPVDADARGTTIVLKEARF
jgi:hypothetical protein